MYKPQKTTYSHIEVLDFPANDEEQHKMMLDSHKVKQVDAFAIVLRNFDDPIIDQTIGKADPLRDLQEIETEMILTDMQIAEKRLEKLRLNFKRGVKTAEAQNEEKTLAKVVDLLHQERPLREANLSPEEEKTIRGFQLLTIKQIMLVVNSDEQRYHKNSGLLQSLKDKGYEAVDIAGQFEMELLSLDKADASMFMNEMGIENSARDKIIEIAYKVLGYISFFTVGKKEVRSWTITGGYNAQEAAGKVHSDMERGFIRAECFHYDELMEFGSERSLKEKGKIRIEGKSYIVNDGDIMFIRFSV